MAKKQLIDWITTKEAAQICGVSTPWIRRLIRRGVFKRYNRVGNVLLIDREEAKLYSRSIVIKYGAKGEKMIVRKSRGQTTLKAEKSNSAQTTLSTEEAAE